jgi:hypothetical protein
LSDIQQQQKMFVQAAGASASLAKLPPDFRPRLMDMWILNQLAQTITRYAISVEVPDPGSGVSLTLDPEQVFS